MAKRAAKPKQDEPEEQTRHIGRPSGYKPSILPMVGRAAASGMTLKQIAVLLEIDLATLHRWKSAYPAFRDALKVGRDEADDAVERSLYENALNGDTTAQIFWLKNRRRKEWTTEDSRAESAVALLEQFMRLALSKVISGEANAVAEGRHAGDDPAVGQIPFGILPGSASSDS